jgi:hypothetical protein
VDNEWTSSSGLNDNLCGIGNHNYLAALTCTAPCEFEEEATNPTAKGHTLQAMWMI